MQDKYFRAAGRSAKKTQNQLDIHSPQFESLEDRVLLDASPVIQWNQDDAFILGDGGLTIGIDGFDADGDVLDISLSCDDNDAFGWHITDADDGNRYAQLNFEDSDGNPIGSILVQLFETRGELAAERFVTLATNYIDDDDDPQPATVDDPAYYTDVVVHRVIPEFMFQTGDAENGDGTGGSGLGDFDNDTDEHLSFAGRGVLAMANSGVDTNDSQFFITAAPTTWLDGNYSIFGQVVSGWDVYEQIISSPTDTSDRPHEIPVLASVDIVSSDQDGAVTIWAENGFDEPTDVTITVTDVNGNTAEKTITIYPPDDIADTPSTQAIDDIEYEPGEIQPDIAANIPFEIDYTSDDPISVISWVKYDGEGSIVLNIVDPVAEGEDYTLELTLPASYDGSEITIYVSSKLTGYDNAAPSNQSFTLSLGSRPDVENPGLTSMAVDSTDTITLDITDDTENFTLEATTDQAGVIVSIDSDTHELTVTTPADFYGVFTVTITAFETEFAAFTGLTPTSVELIFATLGDRPTISAIVGDRVLITLGNTEPGAPVTLNITDDGNEDMIVEVTTDFDDVTIGITDEDDDGIYEVTITLDDDSFRGAFDITVTAVEDVVGSDSLEATSYTFNVTTLGDRPVIANPTDDIQITGGVRYSFDPEITDDTGLPLKVTLDTEMAGTYVWLEEITDINGNVIDWEVVVDMRSLPVDYSGFFEVTITAIEEDVDAGLDPTEKTFYVFASPDFDPDVISILTPELDASITVIEGDRLYVGTEKNFEIYDITDPADPQLLGSFDTSYEVTGIAIRGDYAYISQLGASFGDWIYGAGRVNLLDISDPSDIEALATMTTSSKLISGIAVSADGTIVYAANQTRGMSVFDLNDYFDDDTESDEIIPSPFTYTEIGGYSLGAVADMLLYEDDNDTPDDTSDDINILYVMKDAGRMLVVDVNNIVNDIAENNADAENDSNDDGNGDEADDAEITPVILNKISTNIRSSSRYDQNGHKIYNVTYGTPSMAVIDGTTLFLADSTTGIYAYDITDPTRPDQQGWTGWASTYIAVYNDIAVVSEGGFHRILDVSDLKKINVIQRMYAPGWVGTASISDNIISLPFGSEGVMLLDTASLENLETDTGGTDFETPDGTKLKFKVNGAGLLRLHTDNDGNLILVELTGTYSNTSLTITADQNYDLCDLDIYGNIKNLVFNNINATGNITINGSVANIFLEDAGDTATEPTLTITGDIGESAQMPVNIIAADVNDWRIDSSVPINKLFVRQWTDDETLDADYITAPSINKLKVSTGDFQADVTLNSNGDSPKPIVMGKAVVKGSISESTWEVNGLVGQTRDASGPWDDYNQNLDLRDTLVYTSRNFLVGVNKMLKVKISGGGHVLVSPGNTPGWDIESLEIINSTANTVVTIITNNADFIIGNISAENTLKAIRVKNATLGGNVNIAGDISQLILADIGTDDRSEQSINIDGDNITGGSVDIIAGNVSDLRINSELIISSLKVDSWLDDESDIDDDTTEVDTIKAPAIGKLISRGDFTASLEINTEASATDNLIFDKAIIGGDLYESDWDINGHLNQAKFKGHVTGEMSFNSAGRVIINGNATDWTLNLALVADNDGKVLSLDRLEISGWLDGSRILAKGNMGVIIVRSVIDSDIYAGYLADDPDEVTGLPTEAQLEENDPYIFDPDAGINNFVVLGRYLVAGNNLPPISYGFVNSAVVASNIGYASVRYADTDPAEDLFGIASRNIGKFRYRDMDKQNHKYMTNLGETGAGDNTVLENFIIRIV